MTWDYVARSKMKSTELAALLIAELKEVQQAGVLLSGGTNDGARFQLNALDWRHENGIQKVVA